MSGLPVLDELRVVPLVCGRCGEFFVGFQSIATGHCRRICGHCRARSKAPTINVPPPMPDVLRGKKIAALKRKPVPERLSGVLRQWLDVVARLAFLGGVLLILGWILSGLLSLGRDVATWAF